MTKKKISSDSHTSKAKARARDRNQTKASFIIVSITIVFIGTFFFGLHYLNKAARDNSNSNTSVNNEVVDTVTTSPNQLVIVHTGQTVVVEKFDVSLNLLAHKRIDETTVESDVEITFPDGQTQSVIFTKIGERQVVGDFTLRLANATDSAAQIVIQEN